MNNTLRKLVIAGVILLLVGRVALNTSSATEFIIVSVGSALFAGAVIAGAYWWEHHKLADVAQRRGALASCRVNRGEGVSWNRAHLLAVPQPSAVTGYPNQYGNYPVALELVSAPGMYTNSRALGSIPPARTYTPDSCVIRYGSAVVGLRKAKGIRVDTQTATETFGVVSGNPDELLTALHRAGFRIFQDM